MPEYKFELKFQPLIPERWKDLVTLFCERGACGGCWCSIAPRNTFSVLGRSRILKQIDDEPVWSVVFALTGLATTFRKAGFKEVLCRSETDPL